MRRLLVAVFLILVIASSGVAAQEYTKEHLRAAEEMLIAMNAEGTLSETIDTMLDAQLQQNPEIAQFADVLEAFLRKYMSWENLKGYYIQIYAEAFTEQELREITAFYRTETGQKLVKLTPELTSKGMALGQEIVMKHLPELQQMILQRMQELNSTD